MARKRRINPSNRCNGSIPFLASRSLGSASWNAILTFLPFLIVGVILAICTAPALNALALGDDVAKSQGVQLTTLRIFSAFAGVVLCAVATALAGPIGFIGLLATHLVRLLLGPDLRIVIPMAAIAGAVVLTLADVVGRVIGSPGELEVGIVTALIGAPLLIYLAIKLKVRSL
nr:iron ABC transporter permease [Geomicrobium sp. JCM 19055]